MITLDRVCIGNHFTTYQHAPPLCGAFYWSCAVGTNTEVYLRYLLYRDDPYMIQAFDRLRVCKLFPTYVWPGNRITYSEWMQFYMV